MTLTNKQVKVYILKGLSGCVLPFRFLKGVQRPGVFTLATRGEGAQFLQAKRLGFELSTCYYVLGTVLNARVTGPFCGAYRLGG